MGVLGHFTIELKWPDTHASSFRVSGHIVTPGLSPGSGCLATSLHRGCLLVLGVWPHHHTGAVSWFWVSSHIVTPVPQTWIQDNTEPSTEPTGSSAWENCPALLLGNPILTANGVVRR